MLQNHQKKASNWARWPRRCWPTHKTQESDLRVFVARLADASEIVGVIFFTRLSFKDDTRNVFVLGPVAVATEQQRKGVGRQLITHGLAQLRSEGVDVALTYGDPKYYTRFGFEAISENDVPAPFPLQQPHGWLGQALQAEEPLSFNGPSTCVDAMNNPAFW